jgi:hypothetical protein
MANNPRLSEVSKDTQFSSENQPENPGRKRNRFKEIQLDYELSINDMRQVIQDILSMNIEEIKELAKDRSEPAYRLAIASAIAGCIKSGNWTQINYMFDRLFGKAIEAHRMVDKDNNDLPIVVNINGVKS